MMYSCLSEFVGVVLCNREEDSAMVFVSNEVGEHSITTRDLSVNENTIIQFEVLDSVLVEMPSIVEQNLGERRKLSDNFMRCNFSFLCKAVRNL